MVAASTIEEASAPERTFEEASAPERTFEEASAPERTIEEASAPERVAPTPKRLIRDDPNDPALNYLDSISRELRVEEVAHCRAGNFRRVVSAVFDLMISAFFCAPFVIALKLTSNDFHDVRILAVSSGVFVVITFLYLTFSVALTGRTWAMRSLSLRVIDTKTGLIPTGAQSAGRAFLYLISLGAAGVGILYALFSREGYTAHDRATRTSVIAT
jgi:uncharacterized RDD family membrane protein YckC